MKYSIENMKKLINSLSNIPDNIIEGSLLKYIIRVGEYEIEKIKNYEIINMLQYSNNDIVRTFYEYEFPIDLEVIVDFFEALLAKDNVTENGIVFTPMYISDYIVSNAINYIGGYREDVKIMDPGCGCGIFLISAIKFIHENYEVPIRTIVKNNIYGIDLDPDNTRRCKFAISIFELITNGEINDNCISVIQGDSLKLDWDTEFKVKGYDVIIGNPPYVNTHDMQKSTAKFLKETFETTKTGVYNIFYAFIEHGIKYLSGNGVLSYIVPNNFLTIKSAQELRKMLKRDNYIKSILDFGDNMVFKPVRTYNCIIKVSKTPANDNLQYYVMPKSECIKLELDKFTFNYLPTSKLDDHGWHLVDSKTMENIKKIESQFYSIKPFIRTGIATLRDAVYIVDHDKNGYYKLVNNTRYNIEEGAVKRLYKIPELKNNETIEKSCRYIIFPYKKGIEGFEILLESELKELYPNTFEYLLTQKEELASRDKGNPKVPVWYAYGRTQGLNKYGYKLLFPTFANTPNFTLVEDEYALFCNGYAVFENNYIDLTTLNRILNSKIMEYYVNNTSYSIEGGYYCYQKKYIERFSLPLFSEDEIKKIQDMTDKELNEYLIGKYNLNL